MLGPETIYQEFRGQQEVRGQTTDPMNSCFPATALFFGSSLPVPVAIFFPWPFSFPSAHLSPISFGPHANRTYFHLSVSSYPSVRSTYVFLFPFPLPTALFFLTSSLSYIFLLKQDNRAFLQR